MADPHIDPDLPVTSSPVHMLGKVNGFVTCAIWGGPSDDGWPVHWVFVGEEERTLQVTRTFTDVRTARVAFRSTRAMIAPLLAKDMLAATGLPF